MKISIRLKFSVFLAMLLLMTVFILSLLVLEGIKSNQQNQYEQYLARQVKTANTYFRQRLLSEQEWLPQNFLAKKGQEFAGQLELISGLSTVLYDMQGEIISAKNVRIESELLKTTLDYARNNKTAYLLEGEAIFYLAPLKMGKEQAGVVQFKYSLTQNIEFYQRIKRLFITIGAGVFILSFLLGNLYYNSFVTAMIKLYKTVNKIREGDYNVTILRRKDEIGKLSQGIKAMSERIKTSMEEMEGEQKKLELAVQKLSAMGEQQKQFIGNVTHEFKTPLTSIHAYLDLLEMYPDDVNLLDRAVGSIKDETQRLYEMVEKVLQLSALEKYDFELHLEQIEVKQAIEMILNSLQGKIDKFGIGLTTDLREAYVYGDRDSMTIVLINLLDNAIKYNKAGGTIRVTNEITDRQVRIEISDTGIGIPTEQIKRIFEPFYMVDKNRSRESGGTGLGLSIARKQAEMMGGTVELVKTGEQGTCFQISIPVSDR